MGLVYEGLHRDIDKRVAVKVLRDDLSRRPEVVARFRQEAKSASRIGHENIVDISDFGETTRGASYFVMEFLEGESLADRLDREKQLGERATVEIIDQVLGTVDAVVLGGQGGCAGVDLGYGSLTAGVAVAMVQSEQQCKLACDIGLARQEDAVPRHEHMVEDRDAVAHADVVERGSELLPLVDNLVRREVINAGEDRTVDLPVRQQRLL